jgi:hypothetical protein
LNIIYHCSDGAARILKFANAVINDTTHHMEEALKALATVREMEVWQRFCNYYLQANNKLIL